MIKKLQRSFIRVALLSISVVLLIVGALINGVNWLEVTNRTTQVAMMVAENQGQFPKFLARDGDHPDGREGFRADDAFATRYAAVSVTNGEIQSVDTTHISELSEADVRSMVATIVDNGQISGWQQHYRFAVATTDNTSWIVLVDSKRDVDSAYRLLMITLAVFVGSILVVAALIAYFSKRAVQPFVMNIQKQREFISNASHEIKTPLAVLSANNDLLEMSGGSNRWTDSNKRQIQRLNELIEQMLLLSRYDEGSVSLQQEDLLLSDVVAELQMELQPVLEERAVQLEITTVHESIVHVERSSTKQLLRILLENAIKYTTDKKVAVRIQESSLQVMNASELLEKAQLEQLFDRFYRVDSSRNRSIGGSGMGLAIAQSIAQQNQQTLSVDQAADGIIIFKLQQKK